jgi:S1-C subfamily serine protease
VSDPNTCASCKTVVPPGARFCPSCGLPSSSEQANWYERLCAAGVDGAIFLACTGTLIWIGLKWWVAFPIWLVLTEIGYQLRGSIGKSLLGQYINEKSRHQHYLRETIGKIASTATFGIGFLMILSKERLALHDYMANTSVLRTGNAVRVRQAIVSVGLLTGAVLVAYFAFNPSKVNHNLPSFGESKRENGLDSIVSQMPGVMTIYVYNGHGKVVGQGSGFVISSDGICATNFHVLKDAYSADAKLGDGRLFHLLAVHAYDAERDIAIFQLGRKTSKGIERARDLPFLTLSSEGVQIGERIATVSSPEGLSNSIADGLVSAIRHDSGRKLLQISAPISPGSSGGPVFNLRGEVVAISTFQLVEGQNLNFAIPVDEVSKMKDLRENLSLEQVYWQNHLAPVSRAASRTQKGEEQQESARQPASRGLTGSFLGTVHNLTADVTANFGIFVEEDQGVVWGCMAVRSPLYGSGPLYGSVQGKDINFTVNSSIGRIDFSGIREGRQISGSYSVENTHGTLQQGEFVLRRDDFKRLPESFDPTKDCPTDADMNK